MIHLTDLVKHFQYIVQTYALKSFDFLIYKKWYFDLKILKFFLVAKAGFEIAAR